MLLVSQVADVVVGFAHRVSGAHLAGEHGLDALVQSNAVLALLYTGRIASGANAHALKANLTVRF